MGVSGGHRPDTRQSVGFYSREINCHRSAAMEQGFDVMLLFIDLSKDFDSVPHVPLLHHLKDTGLNPYIVQWIAFYLLNRKQYDLLYQPTPQLCLVSHKGDLCCFISLSNGAQMTLYADDLLLIKPIKDANDYISLQQDITNTH